MELALMDPAGPSSHISVASSSTSGSLSFSPLEYGQFKGQAQHQIMVLQRMYQELRKSFTTEQNKTQELLQEIDLIKDQTKPLTERIVNLQKIVGRITDENSSLKKSVDHQDNATKKLKEETNEEINMLKSMIETLANTVEGARLSGSGATSGSPFVIPPNFAEITSVLEQQMGSYDVKLAETDLRFQILETTNYNGILIWKIRDFNRRKDDAKRGGALSIYSQPFYTSKYGYKMCLRIYLNGDGMGKNTHISLFFVLMKGEYDALLPFPFRQKVSLFLLDQTPERRHLTDVFRPEAASSSFKKPNSDMNIASGCPMFVSHDTLKNGKYVVDETIFIKAIIETTDLENY